MVWNDRLESTQFQIKGDASAVSLLQQKLDADEARKYLSSNESDFEKDPIGQTLFKYYHGLLQELILENKEATQPNEEELHIEEQRAIADDLTEQAIEEYATNYGVYEGTNYEYYVNSLDPEIQDIIVSQLNFTKNIFEEAQAVREQIIADGGTYEEAQQAYLEMLAIPKEKLEQFNQQLEESIDEESEEKND